MARTNRPLRILVHPDLSESPQVLALVEKQNPVDVIPCDATNNTYSLEDYDIVLGPNCWRIVPGMEGQIDQAVKAARRIKYGKKENDDGLE